MNIKAKNVSELVGLLEEMAQEEVVIKDDRVFRVAAGGKHAEIFVTYQPETELFELWMCIAADLSLAEGAEEGRTFLLASGTKPNEVASGYDEYLGVMQRANDFYGQHLKITQNKVFGMIVGALPSLKYSAA